MPDSKRNLSSTKLVNNTALIKEATTPKLNYNRIKKEKDEISFIAEKELENKIIVNDSGNKNLNETHISNSFNDEIFNEENLDYLNDPLENNFKSSIDEFKAVYNEAYISM